MFEYNPTNFKKSVITETVTVTEAAMENHRITNRLFGPIDPYHTSISNFQIT